MTSVKLWAFENEDRKIMKRNFFEMCPKGSIERFGRYTVVSVYEGTNVRFAVSMAGDTETKWRRKVGEYHALNRWFDGQAITLRENQFHDLMNSMATDDSEAAYLLP